MIVKLKELLSEQKGTIGQPDGNGLELIGVSNEIGLHPSRAKKINNLSRYKTNKLNWFAYNPMRINVGSIGYAKTPEHLGLISPDYVVFSCSDKILPEYLLWLLKSEEGQEAIIKNASGAVRKRLYFRNLAQIEIELPSIEIQKKRVDFYLKVKEVQDTIAKQLSKSSYISQLKQAILQEAIEGKLTEDWRIQNPNVEPAEKLLERIKAEKQKLIEKKEIKKEKPLPPITKEEIPFELPKGWVWCRLGEISMYIQRGKSPRYVENSSVPVVSQKCVQWDRFDFHKARFIDETTLEKYGQERFLRDGDLLWNSTGDGTVGRLVKFYNSTHFKKIVADSHVTIVRLIKMLNSSFILKYLSTDKVQNNLKVSGSTKQTELSRGTIINHLVPLAPKKEQVEINQKVDKLMQKANSLETQIKQNETNAKMLMQAVLKEAFEK